jgi:hypothetical protein
MLKFVGKPKLWRIIVEVREIKEKQRIAGVLVLNIYVRMTLRATLCS